jgi:hypothetical protein
MSPSVKRDALRAVGPSISDPAVIKDVKAESPAVGKIQPGDTIVSVDGRPIASIAQFATAVLDSTPDNFVVQRGAERLEFPSAVLADVKAKTFNVFTLAPLESFATDLKSVTGPTLRSARVHAGRISGDVLTSVWRSQPNLIEVELRLGVPEDCGNCELRDIAVMDLSRKAWLTIVPMADATFAVVPPVGQAGQPIAVPPPTLVGTTATTVAQGTATAQVYGNTATGRYSGTATTTTAPIYDYSNQYAALGHNLGVALRNAKIETANRERVQFANVRLGNLRAGKLNPGEYVTGHLFFAAPAGFEGPYAVVVDAGENAVGLSQFSRTTVRQAR